MSHSHDTVLPTRETRGAVGIVSSSRTAVHYVECLLSHEGVDLPKSLLAEKPGPEPVGEGQTMLAALRTLQADPEVEVIALIAQDPPLQRVESVLSQVRDSEKPTVVCFLGVDQRLIWRAGAIPSARLDETAMRAAAWVRGWDQALVTSRLEDEDDRLVTLAGELYARIPPGRRLFRGFFESEILRREAQLLLADVAGDRMLDASLHLLEGMAAQKERAVLQDALADQGVAVILLNVVLRRDTLSELARVPIPQQGRHRPVIVASLCYPAAMELDAARTKSALHKAGVQLAPSSAAAARLAGMLVHRLAAD